MQKRTKKFNGLVDWDEKTKKFLFNAPSTYGIFCIIKIGLDECGLERIDDGCLSTYKMDGVNIDIDPTWEYITLSANGLKDYEIPYQHPERIASSFFVEIREYWRKFDQLNRSNKQQKSMD